MTYYNPGTNRLINVDGNLVEEDALRIAEAIKEYDPDLEILCLKPEEADPFDPPFIICHKQSNGVLRPIFKAWELDARVLDRIRLSDGQVGNVIATMEKMEANIKKNNDYRYRDILDSKKDLVSHIAANRKSLYTFRDDTTGELVTIYDDRPSKRT